MVGLYCFIPVLVITASVQSGLYIKPNLLRYAQSRQDLVLKLSAGAQLERKASRLASGAMWRVKRVSLPAGGEGATFQDSGRPNAQLQPVLTWVTTWCDRIRHIQAKDRRIWEASRVHPRRRPFKASRTRLKPSGCWPKQPR